MAIDKETLLGRIGKKKEENDKAIDDTGKGKDNLVLLRKEEDKARDGNDKGKEKEGQYAIEGIVLPNQKPSILREEEGEDFLKVHQAGERLIDRNLPFGIMDGKVSDGTDPVYLVELSLADGTMLLEKADLFIEKGILPTGILFLVKRVDEHLQGNAHIGAGRGDKNVPPAFLLFLLGLRKEFLSAIHPFDNPVS